jgi:hypothetical protein
MDDARPLLAELQRSNWVENGLDYDDVMAHIAAGQPAALVVSRVSRHQAVGGIRASEISERDRQLLAELTAIARAPYVSARSPSPPDVGLARLEADFLATTGRSLRLELHWENYPQGEIWLCAINLDGKGVGSVNVSGAGPEERLADLADRVCEGWLHEAVWGGWPLCKRHPRRPMWAGLDAGVACWICEADPTDRVPIGELASRPAEGDNDGQKRR